MLIYTTSQKNTKQNTMVSIYQDLYSYICLPRAGNVEYISCDVMLKNPSHYFEVKKTP